MATDNTETNISGATASTYTLVAADQGTTIKVTVSFTDDASNPETRTSAATAAVAAEVTGTPEPEPFEVEIVGVPEVAVTGESYELTVQSDEDSLVYAWRVDGGAIEPDDVQMVVWTAPETAGVAWIHVDVTREDGAKAGQSAYVRVEVPEPEPEPLNSAANLSDKPGPPHQIERKNDDENHNRNNTSAVDVHSRVRG